MLEVRLHPKRDKRARAGHPWIFSNELDTDVAALPAGGAVDVLDAKGAFIGRGYANPASLIAVRLLTRNRRDDIDHHAFYAARLYQAKAYRERLYPDRRALRWVSAEGDWLPGLVVDGYNDLLSVQISTLGMEQRKELLAGALQQVFSPAGMVLRSEGRARKLEGLPDERAVWSGEVPDQLDFDEFGVRFRVAPLGGQKTGHFFDQAENRRFAGSLCRGRKVLDVYANSGGFALHALHHGASQAVAVDKASDNAERALQNADLNGFGDRLRTISGEGRKTLTRLAQEGARFDVVVLDPPAFAKTRKAAGAALRGYRDINQLGIRLLQPGGLLVTSSCSYHVDEDRYVEAIRQGAAELGRALRVVRRGEQAPDHPVRLGVPETRYLKHYVFEVGLR